MKKIIFTLFFALFLYGVSPAKINNTIEPELQNILTQRSDDKIDISIILKSQVNTSKLMAKAERSNSIYRKDFVVSELKEFSKQTQSDILTILQAEEKNGNVADINSLWIINAINCKATSDVIYRLASHPDVEVLTYNQEVQLISKEEMKDIEVQSSRALPVSHIVTINADHVWEQGYTGKNVVVAVLDSGTNEKHHDIKSNLWEGLKDIDGDGIEDIINGWNFISNNAIITDDFGHGTHCAGIICGDGTSGQITGVAPDAKLMTVKTVNRVGSGTVAQMLSGVQFAVENEADILSMSLGFKHYQTSISQREQIRAAFDNVLSAGVIVCAAAGNDGNTYGAPNNIDYPAACPSPWRNPGQTLEGGLSSVVCVGAYDLGMSSRGPSTWEGTSYNDYTYNEGAEMGLIRPDICAPGNLVYSLNSSIIDKYNQKSGTSQATPCVAGVMALMLEKNSTLTPAQITEIIEITASNKPVTKNNVVGAGRIDALAAVNAVTEGTPQPFLTIQSYTPIETSPGDKTVSITIKNEGRGSCLTTTNGTLLLDDSYISISEPNQTIGQVSTGYTRTLNYDISISDLTPNGHVANFTYVIKSGDFTWKYPFSITISQIPKIVFKSVTPGAIGVNQDIDISVTMHNIGTADMPNNTKLTLSTLPANGRLIDIINGETTIGSLGVGETASGTFTIRANDEIPHNRTIEFFLEVESELSTTTNFAYEFENDNEGWTSFDAANNGIDNPWWHSSNDITHGKTSVKSHSGNGHIMSETMITSNGQMFYTNPIDNYLVSPEKIKVTNNSKISFYACANHNSYYAEHFGLAISTTGNNTGFTTIQEWTIGSDQKTEWREYVADLSAYAGQEIYVAIRHFFTPAQWEAVDNGFKVDALNIDDITLHDVAMNLHHIPTYSDDDPNYFTIIVNNQIDLPMPQDLSASANGTDRIDLMWTDVDKAKGYNIYRDGVKITSSTSTYYIDTNLEHNTEYCYEVAAVYNSTEGERATACATTQQKNYSVDLLDYTPKTIYMGVNDDEVTFTLVVDGSMRLPARGWISLSSNDPYFNNTTKPSVELTTSVIDPDDESTYTINIGIDPDIPNRHTIDFNINVLSGGTQDGEEYEFNLPFSILVKNDPYIPMNLVTDSISGNSISLSWDEVTEAIFYNVYRDGEFLGSTASRTYFDIGLDSETTYCYEVTSITEFGESDTSEKVCATTLERKNKILLQSFVLDDPIGETTLTTTLINKGNVATPAMTTATLKSNDPYVTIINETVNVGSIAVDGTATATYTIRIDNAVPLNHDIHFDLIAEFEGEDIIDLEYTFDNDFEGWTNYIWGGNNNYVWEYDATNKFIKSASRKNNQNLSPDNFICSPSKVKATADTKIVYDVKSSSSDYYAEHYAVYYSEVDPYDSYYGWYELTNHTLVHENTLTQDYAQKWVTESIDLSSAAGKDIWVTFRHFECKGQAYIIIDNIELQNVAYSGLVSYKNSFFVTVNPSINIFTGAGLWSDASRWNKRYVPLPTEDAIINGDATIESGDITVNSLVVNKHLTINSDINVTVSNVFYNANPDNLLVNDGVQIFHNSDKLAATYRMNIARPQSWGYDLKGGWQLITSPVKDASVYDFAPEVADYDLFKYDGTQELEWINLKNHATDFESTFQQGRGYIVSYEAQATAEFKGILHNRKSFTFTDIKAKDDSKHVYNFYLLGNPFSFDMNWDEITATDVYNGYATINSSDGSYDYHTNGTIKVGDGFFVISTGPAASLTYGATRKAHKEKCYSLNVVASNFYGLDNVIINLDGNTDYGFKKLNNINTDISEIFISNSDERYGIFSFDDNTNEVPISFKATKTGEHRICIDAEGEFEYITLVDKFTGVETDMLKNDYSFKVLSTGGNRERFTVKFSKKTKETTENFAYQSGDELIINAEGQIQIIDVMGRIVYSNKINGDTRINISHLNKATYIIHLTNEIESKTQKIVVY